MKDDVRNDWLHLAVIDKGLLTVQQLEDIKRWDQGDAATNQIPGGLLEKLYRSNLVSGDVLLSLLVEQGAKDATAELEAGLPSPAALGALDRETASRTRSIPLSIAPPRLVVGMLDPSDAGALERVAFYCGLLVEPRAVRAEVLFQALHDAYDIPVVSPDPSAFSVEEIDLGDLGDLVSPTSLASEVSQESENKAEQDAGDEGFATDDETQASDALPPPSKKPLLVKTTGIPSPQERARTPQADPSTSPLAAQLVSAAGGQLPDYAENPIGHPPAFGWLRNKGPSSPVIEDLPTSEPDTDTVHLRDTLPPQVLPLLEKRFRTAILFLVRENVAVGWDGMGDDVDTEKIRNVLIPLTAQSAFARAWAWGMVAAGSPREPTTIERIFFRFLGKDPPRAFVVMPVRVGEKVSALIYLDLDLEVLDEDMLEVARQVGSTLADALAPLVAENRVFG